MSIKPLLLLAMMTALDAQADFIVVPKKKMDTAPAINYPTPSSAFELNRNSFSRTEAAQPVLKEVGDRTLLSQAVAPTINSYGAPVSYIIGNIVPKGMALEIVRDPLLQSEISFKSDGETNWLHEFNRLLLKSNLHAQVNWNNGVVSVFTGPERKLVVDSTAAEVIDDNGEEYIIRKKSDDISAINNSGLIIKNGEAYRIRVGE